MAEAAEKPLLALARLRSPGGNLRGRVLLGVSGAATIGAVLLLLSGHPGLALRAYCGTVLLLLAVVALWSRQAPGLRAAK